MASLVPKEGEWQEIAPFDQTLSMLSGVHAFLECHTG